MSKFTLCDLPAAFFTLWGLLLFPMLYVASYLALSKPVGPLIEPEKGNYILRIESYRIGGEVSRLVFRPLHEIDRRVRPRYWLCLTEKGKGWFTSDELKREGFDKCVTLP